MIGSRLGLVIIAAVLGLGTGLAGCQVVAGIEDRSNDPILPGCRLPTSTGGATIRFADLVPSDGSVDVCVRQSGSSYGRPILRGGGSECPAGFSYAQVSAPFSAPDGKVDVRVVAGGSTCKAAAIAEALAVPTPKGSSTTFALLGHPPTGRQLRAYPEATAGSTTGADTKFRIIHAIPNGPPLIFGFANASRLPTDIGSPLLVDPLSFSESTKADTKVTLGRATPDGYIEIPGTAVSLGAAPVGTPRATMVTEVPKDEGGRTIWAIGDANNNAYPVRALFCQDMAAPLTGSKVALTNCQQSALPTIAVDVVNASLNGGRVMDEAARRAPLIDAIRHRPGAAGADSDLMCILGLGRTADRDAVIQAAKDSGAFPYSVSANSNLDTGPTDARDQKGNVPPKPTAPPCNGGTTLATVESAISCVKENCSTTHTDDGVVVPAVLTADGNPSGGTACLSTKCAPLFIQLLAGDTDQKRCFDCLGFSASSYETHAETRAQCTTDKRDYKLFQGATTSIILSKFPIKASETFTLPATLNQRVVHHAEVEIEPNVTIDYYCAELTPSYGTLVPNYSAYANGATGGQDWFEEQKLQARLVLDWVKQKSGTRPAIVSGDWAASKGDTDHGISGSNPAVVDMLEAPAGPFSLAVPKAYVPHCTECAAPENPYNTDSSTWELKTYLFNMPKGVDSADLFWKEFTVLLSNGKMGPLSHRWGFTTRVIRP